MQVSTRSGRTITVGIYGRIGSGKSEVAAVFAEKGAAVISADRIGKDVVDQDESVLSTLVNAFGREIVDSDGFLRRRELGKLAFASHENRVKLDSIVHPPLLRRLRAAIEKHRDIERCSMVVVDAALILHWGMESELDILVCVTAPENLQVERMMRSGLSESEARSRLEAQIDQDEQASKADFVIRNDRTLEDLRKHALSVYDQIRCREKTV